MKYIILFLLSIKLFAFYGSTIQTTFESSKDTKIINTFSANSSLENPVNYRISLLIKDNLRLGINLYPMLLPLAENDYRNTRISFGFDLKYFIYENNTNNFSFQFGMPMVNIVETGLSYGIKTDFFADFKINFKYQYVIFYYSYNTTDNYNDLFSSRRNTEVANDSRIGITLSIGGKYFWIEGGYLFPLKQKELKNGDNIYFVSDSKKYYDLRNFVLTLNCSF